MMGKITEWFRSFQNREDPEEREKMARLEAAEGDLRLLRARADLAVRLLTERNGRNHWRESIEDMIRGAS